MYASNHPTRRQMCILVLGALKLLITDSSGNASPASSLVTTALLGGNTLSVSLSAAMAKGQTLAQADANAARIGAALVVDTNVTLIANTALASKHVVFLGGTITTGRFNLALNSISAGDTAIFDKTGTGTISINAPIEANALWFGATRDATNDSNPLQRCANTGKPYRIPAGAYACNYSQNNFAMIRGDGTRATVLYPYTTSSSAPGACITYTQKSSPQFFKATKVTGICFQGRPGSILNGPVSNGSIGWAMAQTNPATYVSGNELVGDVTFENCVFMALDKGIFRPFGNIGLYVRLCEFRGNNYGTYSLNNKFGGSGMHAGVMTISDCEYNGNLCTNYIHNTQNGFGQLVFDSNIYEGNQNIDYIYNSGGEAIAAIAYRECWSEQNGPRWSSSTGTTTLDQWSGRRKSPQTFNACCFYFDGSDYDVDFKGGFFSGCVLAGKDMHVSVGGAARFETTSGFGGQANAVENPANSSIDFYDVVTVGGGIQTAGCEARGIVRRSALAITSTAYGPDIVPHRAQKGVPGPKGVAQNFNRAATLHGTSNLPGTVTADSTTLYGNCNQFSVKAVAGNLFGDSGDAITLAAGRYYLITIGTALLAGSARFLVWDRSRNAAAAWTDPGDGKRRTWACIVYCSASATIYLDCSAQSTGTLTWQWSEFQILPFTTQAEAEDYLMSRNYAG